MKLTLLQIVQSILSRMNSDQVNSISDTPESLQVADMVRTTYMNMLGRYELPEHVKIIQLTPSNSSLQPTLMLRPEGITRIEWIKYFDSNSSDSGQTDQYGSYSHDLNVDLQNNASPWSTISTTTNTIGLGSIRFTVPSGLSIAAGNVATAYNGTNSMTGTVSSYIGTTLIIAVTTFIGSGTFSAWNIINSGALPAGPGYKEVRLLAFDEFIRMICSFDPTEPDVGSYQLGVLDEATNTTNNFTIYYKNDKQPQYCAILANNYILFDSFDNTQDSTLQASKSMAMAWVSPDFLMEDTFIPILDDQQFPLLIADVASLAFYEIKNQPNKKAEEEVAKQLVSVQKWKALADKPSYFEQLPNFGRRGGGWF